MELSEKFLLELQNRLKVGNRRGVHLNAIPSNSRYKFDITRLSNIDSNIPQQFVDELLTKLPLKFRISWKDNVPDLNSLFEEDQTNLVKITKSFENLINQTDAIENEKGINTFGFGFPILIRRDEIDNKLTVAPVLIWSLRIKRTKEFNTWEIHRTEEDPIYINEVLINHLQNDSKITIDQVSSEYLEDGIIDRDELVDICFNIIRSVNSSIPENLKDVFNEKLNQIKPISERAHYEKLPLTSNNSFIEFCGLFSIFEVQKQNIIIDYDSLLELSGVNIDLDNGDKCFYTDFQPISSVETDPSQQSILHTLNNKKNILIQGPPGTGKSQSLTAILVNALENHKKTIVVCEKRTALEVLQDALNKKGLKYNSILIKDIVKDRHKVVSSVRERIDDVFNHEYPITHRQILDSQIAKIRSLIENINKKHKKLDEKLLENRNWTSIVGYLIKEKRNAEQVNKLNLKSELFTFENDELERYLEIIRVGENLFKDYYPFVEISFINSSKFNVLNPFALEQKIKESFISYQKLYDRINLLTRDYHTEYSKTRFEERGNRVSKFISLKDDYQNIINSFNSIVDQFKNSFINIRSKQIEGKLDANNKVFEEIRAIIKKYKTDSLFFDEIQINTFSFKIKAIILKKYRELKAARETLIRHFNKIELESKLDKDLPDINLGNLLFDKVKSFPDVEMQVQSFRQSIFIKVGNEYEDLKLHTFLNEPLNKQQCWIELNNYLFHEFDGACKELFEDYIVKLKILQSSAIEKVEEIVSLIVTSKDLIEIEKHDSIMLNLEELENYQNELKIDFDSFGNKIKNEVEQINVLGELQENYKTEICQNLIKQIHDFIETIKTDSWLKFDLIINNEADFHSQINIVFSKYSDYFQNENDIFTKEYKWLNFFNNLTGNYHIVVLELSKVSNWRQTFLIEYLNLLLTVKADLDLPTNDIDHVELAKSIKSFGKIQEQYVANFWYQKQYDAIKVFKINNPGVSIENIFNKRASFKHRRLSLREIVKVDIDLFTDFFPIILTTPDVACNLFKGKNKYFDIVMFDEASQLKLEDNLPAMLKGQQIIIAGDEHQMPPSNYFSKIFDGTLEDEDDYEDEVDKIISSASNSLLDCESLLDFANEVGFEKRYLDFHYRSRHPFLIDFSNFAFYNQRLRPLPNDVEFTPITFVSVNGRYYDNSNESEAEAVLSILENNIKRLPNGKYPTVGVATFNINQRNLIIGKINERRKFSNYKDFNEKIVELESNGFFVKNLENIQGDERDVIILSTTYGIGRDGKFAQRFGSINHSKGYKLLNVIITRAKFKIYVCTSVPENIYLNYKELLEVEGVNNRRSVFYAYLAYAKAVSENNDIARVAVLNALSKNTTIKEIDDNQFFNLESPFEEEVFEVLKLKFGPNNLFPQYQFAGYRIDIVYDSRKVGIPKIAIECDGAEYHSTREAYLHDLHRQKVLEEHGFVFHRIWSSNWWRNQEFEAMRLFSFIEEILRGSYKVDIDETIGEDVFIDAIEIDFDQTRDIEARYNKEIEDFYVEEEFVNTPNETFDKQIKINSTVKIKYLNIEKDLTLQIVDQEMIKMEKSNGIQKINIKSPLGSALLGHSIGETVKIGDLDKYVFVLDIVN